MHAVLLTIHALVVIALIGVVLLQRSDGGALGLGGGGGGGFMTSRGAANALTRTTSILAAIFFATSIALAVTARATNKERNVIEDLTGEAQVDPNKPLTTDDLSKTLGSDAPAAATTAPAETAPAPAESAPAAPATGDEAPAEAPAGHTPQQ